MKRLFTLLFLLAINLALFPQMPPGCPNPNVYMDGASFIQVYNTSLPPGPGNPSLTNIPVCPGGSGLALMPNINGGSPSPTFYSTSGGTYWWWNGTNWVNTGNSTGNGAAVNIGGCGGFIYNLVGGTGQVYVYNGTGPGTLLTTIPGFSGGGPYDICCDCNRNFFILKTTAPQSLTMYNPSGVPTCSYSLINFPSATAGGGFAIIGNRIYVKNNLSNGFFSGTLSGSSITFTQQTGFGASPGDFASCPTCPTLAVIASNSGTLGCGTGTVNVFATTTVSPVSFTWSGPGLVGPINQSVAVVNLPGVYTATVGSAGCPPTQSIVTTTVVAGNIANITATANPVSVCAGQSSTISMSGGTTYTTNPGVIIGNNIVVTPTVTTIYTVAGTNSLGCTGTTTVQINVNPPPVVTPTNNGPVCAGGTLNLGVGAATSYTWTGPNVFTSNLQNPSITNVSAVNAGIYTVMVNLGGCIGTGTTNVVINPVPVISPTNGGPYCAGSVISLSVGAFSTYNWTGPNSFTSTLQNPSIVNGQVINGGVYNVTVTGIGGCVSTGTTNVVVNALPTPTAISNSPVCLLQPINFTGNGGTTYTWTGPGFNSTQQNPVIAVAQNSNAGTYTLTVTDANGCVNFVTTTVVVNPLPVINVNNPFVCLNQSINLTASGGTAYAWSGPLGYTSSQQNPVIPNSQLNMSGGYTVLVTSAQGCTNTAVANVTVTTVSPPLITNSSPNCVGTTLSFTASAAATYNWTGPNGFTSNLQNPAIPNVQLAAGGVYSLVISIGTCTNSATTSVTINPLPNPLAGSNSPVCEQQPINFTGSGGTTYTWTGPGLNSNQQNPVIAVAQTSNNGTYTLTVTDNNGCVSSTTTPVVVNPTPAIVVNNPVTCENTNINLTSSGGVGYSWSGPLGFSSLQQNPVIPGAQVNMSGAYTVTVTSAQNCTNSAVANVSVIPLPTPNAFNSSPNCVGTTLTFTGSGGSSYFWTGPNGFTSGTQNPVISNVQLAAGGVYSLLVSGGTCTNITTTTVTINPLPNPLAGSNSPVCEQQTINFSGSGGVQYLWSGPNNYSSNQQNPVIPNAQNLHGGTYTLTVTDANNCTNSVTTPVTVNPLPPVSTTNQQVCTNSSINLSANGASSYAWTGPSGFTSNLQNPVILNATVGNSGQYVVIGTSAQGCTAAAVSNVTVLPLPTASITSNDPCIGGTLNLIGNGGTGYTWSGPNNFSSNLATPSLPNVTLNESGVYTLIISAGNCTAMTTKDVTIHPLPNPVLASNSPICLTSPIQINGSGGNSYQWQGPNNYSGTGSNITLANASMNHVGIYTATATDQFGCVNTATIAIAVNPLPVIGTMGSTLCATRTISLSATGGVSFAWSGPQAYSATTASIQIPDAALSMAGDYTVTVTDANSCKSSSVVNVHVNPIPAITVNANSPICAGQSIALTASAPTGVQYFWTGPNGIMTPQQNPQILNAETNASGIYTVIVRDEIGCEAKATVNMLVRSLPVVNITSDKISGCVPLCINFDSQKTTSIVSGYWQFGDGHNAYGLNGSNCYTSPGAYKIYTRFTDEFGCSNISTYNIEAYPIPVADFNYGPSKPIINESIEFSDASREANIATWTWHFSNLPNQIITKPVFNLTYLEPGTYVAALVVMSDKGCADTIVKPIEVGDDFGIYVPNAFTPNGDGVNDVFQPKGYGISKYEMNIFDRWGEKLFTTTNFEQGWDGTFARRGDEVVKEDVYVWKIKIVNTFGKSKVFTGTVSVIK